MARPPLLPHREFEVGTPLRDHLAGLPVAQPDFPSLLEEAALSDADVAPFRQAGVRHVLILTEEWCTDSLHALPLLARLAEALPEADFRVWLRGEHPGLAERIGGQRPPVPHVVFLDADLRELGRFVERPATLTRWLEEESRRFRTRLRLQERARIRTETLHGLVEAITSDRPRHAAPVSTQDPTAGRPLTVFEFWEARTEADRPKLEQLLAHWAPRLAAVEGMLSVEFGAVKGTPGRYLALFRYKDETARAGFIASDAVRQMRAEVDPLWKNVTPSTWAYGLSGPESVIDVGWSGTEGSGALDRG